MAATADRPRTVEIDVYGDVLCIWALCAEIRLEELKRQFGGAVALNYRFIPLFGDTETRIGTGWAERGGFEGFAKHVHEVAERFEHIDLHPDIWLKVRPISSAAAHLFLKAIQLWEINDRAGAAPRLIEAATSRMRRAFFEECRDIASRRVQIEVAEELKLPLAEIQAPLDDGRAFAALCGDAEAQVRHKIDGSPTLVLDQGRQKLFGNVGYRVIEANVQELLREPNADQASWC